MWFSYYYFTARSQMDVNFQRILTQFEVVCSQDQTIEEHRRLFLDFYLISSEIAKFWQQRVRFFLFKNLPPPLTNLWTNEVKI